MVNLPREPFLNPEGHCHGRYSFAGQKNSYIIVQTFQGIVNRVGIKDNNSKPSDEKPCTVATAKWKMHSMLLRCGFTMCKNPSEKNNDLMLL